MIVQIPDVLGPNHTIKIGRHKWRVANLITQARNLPVMDIPLAAINIDCIYKENLREMVGHFKLVEAADLECPIILDEDGVLMDGRHRIMKAIYEGKETIKAVRFTENPPCDWVEDS